MHGGAGHVIYVPNSDHAGVRDIRPDDGVVDICHGLVSSTPEGQIADLKPLALADLHPISWRFVEELGKFIVVNSFHRQLLGSLSELLQGLSQVPRGPCTQRNT